MSEATSDAVSGIGLAEVRTVADAAVWLRARAAGFTEAENAAWTPVDAQGFRQASATAEGLADLLGMMDPQTAGRTLLSMGSNYAHIARNEAARREPAYWRACTHLASTCVPLGARLITATGTRPTPAGRPFERDTGRQL